MPQRNGVAGSRPAACPSPCPSCPSCPPVRGRVALSAPARGLVAVAVWLLAVGVAAFAAAGPAAGPAAAHGPVEHTALGHAAAAVAADQAASEVPARAASITAADRDLLVRVRLAGLWEMPAGQMAAEKGRADRVREIGGLIAEQHVELDRLVVKAAKALEVPLPGEPTTEQDFWLREMRQATGADFDRVFVQRLREAHGKIFPGIAVVRANTRDETVRTLANQANDFVKTHLTLLDSTGVVDYQRLPALVQPVPDDNRFVLLGDPRYPTAEQPVRLAVVVGLLGLAGLVAATLLVRFLFPGAGQRVARPVQPDPPHRRRRPAPVPSEHRVHPTV
jgi:predicted outer membrane protein